ncbi:MAG TPA: MerR family transcriptional regulator [Gemmatimonadales bacterium]
MAARPPEDSIARHPISVVAQRTGLSPDVLRVWERRYGVVEPTRGGAGQRLYSDADIARLRLLRDATLAGRSISQVARLAPEALARLVEEDAAERAAPAAEPAGELHDAVAEVIAIGRALDAGRLHGALRRHAARFGLPRFIEQIAVPALRQVGDEWHAGRLTPAHEHFISTAFHDLLAHVLRTAEGGRGPVVVVATPAGERHVNGALSIAVLAAVSGWRVVFLGADLPAADIATAAETRGAALVALSITQGDDWRRLTGELAALRAALPSDVLVWAGGLGAGLLGRDRLPAGVEIIPSGKRVPELLDRLTAAGS